MSQFFDKIINRVGSPFIDDPRQNPWIIPVLSTVLLVIALWGKIIFKDATSVIWILFCIFYVLWLFSRDLMFVTRRDRPFEILMMGVLFLVLFAVLFAVILAEQMVMTSILFVLLAIGYAFLIYIETKEQHEAMNSYKDAKRLAKKQDYKKALIEIEESITNLSRVKKEDRRDIRRTERNLRKYGDHIRTDERPYSRMSRLRFLRGRHRYFQKLSENVYRDRDILQKFLNAKDQYRQKNYSAANRTFKKLLRTHQEIIPEDFLLKERAKAAEKAGKFIPASEAYRELSLHGSKDIREWALSGLIRTLSKKNLIQKSSQKVNQKDISLNFQCPTCNTNLTSETLKKCSNCGSNIPHCIVCRLPIGKEEEIRSCPHCEAIGHHEHFVEWLHVRATCPQCHSKVLSNSLQVVN